MSSNRLTYDNEELKQKDNERVNPLTYQLYAGKYVKCNWCGSQNPNFKSELSFDERVSIENDVLNIDRKTSKASVNQYKPPCADVPNCELSNHNFVSPLICDRNVAWTNLVKPTGPGFNVNNNDFSC